MSLKDLDDWLKPTDVEPENVSNDVVEDVGIENDIEDPLMSALSASDLQLLFLDLEFLDLASGPSGPSVQDKNKNKHNPTLGNYFPDIFFDTTGQGSSSLFGFQNNDDTRSVIGDHAFESFEKGILADLFPSTTGTGNEDKLLEDFAEINANSSGISAEPEPPPPSTSKNEDPTKIQVRNESKLITESDDNSYSVPMDVLQSISKNFEKLQADFEKSTTPDENRKIRIKSIRTVPPDAVIEDVQTPEGTVATIAIQTNKANNTTTFTILPRLGQTPKQSFLVKTNNLSQATKMIRPLHLDRLPVFKNLFRSNIKVIPPTGTNKVNIKNKSSKNYTTTKKENTMEKIVKSSNLLSANPSVLESELIEELKKSEVTYENIKIKQNSEGKLEWSCPESDCDRIFPKRSQLKLHIFSHKSIKPFKCDQEGCKWSFPTIVRLQRHQKAHEGEKLFKCNLAGCEEKAFTTVYNLNVHIKEHSKESQFKCEICDEGFRGQRLLDLHTRKAHIECVPSYNCLHPGCDKGYYTQADIARHSASHIPLSAIEKARLQCSTCDKEFKIQSKLIAHERVHTGVRPYVCVHPGCQWSFRTSSKLRRHERSHKNDRRYTCQYCSKSYLRPEHLREHVEIVHKNQKLACPYDNCEARFTQRPSLITHVKKHQEDPQSLELSRYRCVIEKCGQKFQSKRNLNQHVNRQHQPELHAASINNCTQGGSNPDPTSDQSELDLMALLSCVAAEMEQTGNNVKQETELDQAGNIKPEIEPDQLITTGNIKPEMEPELLITVDASAITPVKLDPTLSVISTKDTTPNIISKSRKRKQSHSFKISKKSKAPLDIEDNSTINMQDLV